MGGGAASARTRASSSLGRSRNRGWRGPPSVEEDASRDDPWPCTTLPRNVRTFSVVNIGVTGGVSSTINIIVWVVVVVVPDVGGSGKIFRRKDRDAAHQLIVVRTTFFPGVSEHRRPRPSPCTMFDLENIL